MMYTYLNWAANKYKTSEKKLKEIEKDLSSMGHTIKYQKGIFGGYQAIMFKDGVYYGASETRKDGQAAGY